MAPKNRSEQPPSGTPRRPSAKSTSPTSDQLLPGQYLWVERTRLQAGVAGITPDRSKERHAVVLWASGNTTGPDAPSTATALLLLDPALAKSLGEDLIALARRFEVDSEERTVDQRFRELDDRGE